MVLLAAVFAVIAVAAPASARPDDDGGYWEQWTGQYEEEQGACVDRGPGGADESPYLPMNRWMDATTDFHSRLSWNELPNQAQREVFMNSGMSVGNFLYGVSDRMVSGALSFCMLDDAGYELDHATAEIASIFMNSAIMALLLVVAAISIIWRAVKNAAPGKAMKSVFSKAIILGLFGAMAAGATQSTETAAGEFDPGAFSPGWFAVTIDKAVTNLANLPVTQMYTETDLLTGAEEDPEDAGNNIFECDVERAALRQMFQESLGDESSTALVPMVMSSIWENSGMETWKIAQYGKDSRFADDVYCHQLDMFARPNRYTQMAVYNQITPGFGDWVGEEVGPNGEEIFDGQVFTPQGNKQQDVAIIAWAACQPNGSSFEAQLDNLTAYGSDGGSPKDKWDADIDLMVEGGLEDRTLSGDIGNAVGGAVDSATAPVRDTFGGVVNAITAPGRAIGGAIDGLTGGDDDEDSGPPPWDDAAAARSCADMFNWATARMFGDSAISQTGFGSAMTGPGASAKNFNWGNDEGAIIANTSGNDTERDFILNLHGNHNGAGLVGVLIYVISAVGLFLVFGLLALAVLLAKVMAGVLIAVTFFVLLFSLVSDRDLEPVLKYGKTYIGLSLFAWGAIMLMAVIGLLTAILSNLGESFGGWLSVLWSGLSPLLAAVILHKVFKDVLHMPSPFKLTAGLAYGSALGKSGASNAMSGLDSLGNRGAGFLKRTASTAAGSELSERFSPFGKGKGGGGSSAAGGSGTGRDGEYTASGPGGMGAGGAGGAGGPQASAAEQAAALGGAISPQEAARQRAAIASRAAAGDRGAKKDLKAFDRARRAEALDAAKEIRPGLKDRTLNYVGANKGKIAVAGAAAALGGAPIAAGVAGYMGVKAVAGKVGDGIASTTGIGHEGMMQRADKAVADMEAAQQKKLDALQREQDRTWADAERQAVETQRELNSLLLEQAQRQHRIEDGRFDR